MALETKIQATIVAGVDKASVNKAGQEFARDTKKAIDPLLKKKLELNIANATIKLQDLRKKLREVGDNKLLRQKLIIDTNNAQSSLTEAKRKLQNLKNTGDETVSRLKSKFDGLGGSILQSFKGLVSGAAIFGVLTMAVRGFINEFKEGARASREFEKAMSNISTLIDTNVESMEDMKQEVLDLANKSPKALSEITEALYDVRSAGISAEDSISVLDQSIKLAVAGLGSVKEATNLMTSAFNAFSSQGYTAEQIANTLFLTVKNGKTTVAELSQGFGGLAGLAATLGVDFRELMAATSAMTTTGQSASESYSGLKGVLTAVAKQTPKAVNAAKELGIEFSSTALASKGLKGFLEDINQKLKDQGIEGPKATEVLAGMFGRVEALNTVLALTNANQEAFNTSMQDMTTNTTAFMEAYDKQSQTVEARVQRLNNELEVQRIQLGNTTSRRQGFGTFLKIQFLDILNKISTAFAIVGDTIVGVFSIAWESAKGLFTGVGTLIDTFLETGKLDFSKAFNFQGAKDAMAKMRTNIKASNDKANKETAQAIKDRNDFMKVANEELLNNENKTKKAGVKTTKKALEDKMKATKEALAAEKKLLEDNAKVQEKLTDSITKGVEKAQDKIIKSIEAGEKKIDGLRNKLQQLDQDTTQSLAERLAEIDSELGGEDLNSGDRIALQKEKAEAFKGLTAEEVAALKEKAQAVEDYNALSDIGKIKADAEAEKVILQEQLIAEQELQDGRVIALQSALDKEAQMMELSKQLFIGATQAKIDKTNELIATIQRLNAVSGRQSTVDNALAQGSSTTNNTTNNSSISPSIVINGAGDPGAVADMVVSKIKSDIKVSGRNGTAL